MKTIFLSIVLAASSVFAISASRIGPVSTYGELMASNGKLVGTCPQYENTAVQVKGMSLFWSSGNTYSTDFYTEKGVNRLVDDMGVEVIRFALGAADEKFNSSGRSYTTGGEAFQKAMLKSVVNAAIDKDIYVIIDWHIESASGYTSDAVKFFEYAAKEYGAYNNVIFEIWNEPTGDMGTVKNHADQVIPVIRKYSNNLILVGSPSWSSQPDNCANAGINDNNYGCTLHFYAGTHMMGGYDKAAESAMSKGIPVFATEWGTVNANGDGAPNESSSQSWVNWMAQKKISWTNWNASAMDETSSAFSNAVFENGFSYTTSGNLVKGYIGSAPAYKDCGLSNGSSNDDSEFSKGVAPGTKTSMIDDVEDGDRYSYIGGWWNAFEDNGDGGASSLSNSKITDDFGKQTYDVVLKANDGKNTSKYMVGLKDVKLGVGNLSYGPYVALGLNLKKDTTEYADFAKCTTIRYKYKGASHNFRIETSDIKDYNYHRVNKDASEGWKEVEITIDMLKQETWGNDAAPQKQINLAHAQRLAWEIKGLEKVPDNMNQPKYNYLYVDDLSCDGLSITAVGSTTPASSSSAPNSSSSSISISSSSSVISSSSTVIEPGKILIVIDDVEDADEVLKTEGTWYAYTEKEVGGLSSITNAYDATLPGYVVSLAGSNDPSNGTLGFVGLNGIVWNQGSYNEAPFVALGLNTMADTSIGFNMSSCGAISYRYKGSAHTIKVQDGSVTDYAYHQKIFTDASEWTTVIVPWSNLKQPNWTKEPKDLNKQAIKKMAWEVIGYKGFDFQPTLNYLYVDDLTCVEYTDGIRFAKVDATGIKLFADGLSLNVTLSKDGFTRVQIFDMVGNVVSSMSENMTSGTHQVSLKSLSPGSYVVRVQNGRDMKTTRISIR